MSIILDAPPANAEPVQEVAAAAGTCPLCHTVDVSITASALAEGVTWQCARCGQMWSGKRAAIATAYARRRVDALQAFTKLGT